MYKIIKKDINDFFIKYYNDYYKDNNLIYDNMQVFREIIILIYKKLGNYIANNNEQINWDRIEKSTFIEYIPLIEKFYKKLNIDTDINKLIENGTINLYPKSTEELEETKKQGKSLNGTNKYQKGHKVVDVYNNGLITDSITLVHEISHYRNQPDIKRNQVNNLFTEALAFAEEFIYLDYLKSMGYEYETNIIKNKVTETFFFIAADTYPLVKLHLLFRKLGEISEENYIYLFKYNDYKDIVGVLKDIINEQNNNITNFDKDILNNKEIMDKLNDNFISDIMYILAAPLSIYMYEEFKKDNNFINNIKLLNDTLMNINTNNKTVVECLNIIGLSNYNEESLNKISESFKNYINELEEAKKPTRVK